MWCRPPQRPFRVPGASEWIPRTSKTQHWKHGDRPPEYSTYAVSVMALYRSAGSACFVKDIALWGQLESWESQNRLHEHRKPRHTDSYVQSSLDRSFPSAFFSTVPRMYRVFMPCGGPRGQNRFSCPLLPPCDGLTPSLEYSRYVLFVEYAPYLPGGVNEAPTPIVSQ